MGDADAEIAEGIRLSRKAIELGKDDAAALCAGGLGWPSLGVNSKPALR